MTTNRFIVLARTAERSGIRIRKQVRSGLSLLEVVLAIGILLMSLAALAQLVSSGSRAAVDSQLRTEAVIRCQSKLAEVVSGNSPLQAVDGAKFDDDPRWRWSLRTQATAIPDLLDVQISVSREGASGTPIAEYSLRRLLRNPESFVRERTNEHTFQRLQQTLIESKTRPANVPDGKDSDR